VSGGTPLEHRDKLRRAVEAVEAGDADVIVVAYFDRLVRSLRVQARSSIVSRRRALRQTLASARSPEVHSPAQAPGVETPPPAD
jgi:DNA invertase Pin-like site-specific DNA recombinase